MFRKFVWKKNAMCKRCKWYAHGRVEDAVHVCVGYDKCYAPQNERHNKTLTRFEDDYHTWSRKQRCRWFVAGKMTDKGMHPPGWQFIGARY